MLAIIVSRSGEPAWRKTFVAGEINVGSDATNQVVLAADSADPPYMGLVVSDGRVIAVDLKSVGGTYVNAKKMTTLLVIREDALIARREANDRALPGVRSRVPEAMVRARTDRT